ncbi:MAG: twin-arginine translocation signal domain-containing protein, partial [Nitrospinota bacterium]
MGEERRLQSRTRRRFLQAAAGTVGVTLGLLAARTASTPSGEAAPPPVDGRVNTLERMRADLQRALQKPVEQRRWVMVIDARKCIGCNACTVACKAENATPPGVNYRVVPEVEAGEYPNVTRFFMPTQCM